MKKVFLLILFAVALPLASFGDSVTFTSQGGTFSGDSWGYDLTNATLTQVTGLPGGTITGADIGTVSFSTAKLGSISNVIIGGPILAGGFLTITGNGTDSIMNGTLFTGTFDAGTWSFDLLPDGSHLYTLAANVTGTDYNGAATSGAMTFNINTGMSIFPGYTKASGTDSTTIAVPEPAELSMLGTGLIGLIGAIRRKVNG